MVPTMVRLVLMYFSNGYFLKHSSVKSSTRYRLFGHKINELMETFQIGLKHGGICTSVDGLFKKLILWREAVLNYTCNDIQHWFRWWLGYARWHCRSWVSVDQYLWRDISVGPGHGLVLLSIMSQCWHASNHTASLKYKSSIVNELILTASNTSILKLWGSASRAQRPLKTGIVSRQFPFLRGTTWRNNRSSKWNSSRREPEIRFFFKRRIQTFTGWNWNCHVIIVIKTDLPVFVVIIHSGLCKQ